MSNENITTDTSTSSSSNTTNNTTKRMIVSAPGKMLMAGGYLVLDESQIGLVIGVNARFYSSCTIILIPTNTTEDLLDHHNNNNITKIRVISVQFQQEWNYIWDRSTFTLCEVIDDDNNEVNEVTLEKGTTNKPLKKKKKNPFLEKALRIVLLYIDHPNNHHNINHPGTKVIPYMTIQIVGDNDFYSLVPHLQQRQLQKHQIYELPKCLPIVYQESGEIYKTGLGSSACLVTAVIGSILYTLTTTTTITTMDTTSDQSIVVPVGAETVPTIVIERLSQIGHCYAQGKIGSGFDVAAAIHGSHIYQRFDPNILNHLMTLLDTNHNNNNNNMEDTTEATLSSSSSLSSPTRIAMNALYEVVHDDDAWRSNTIEPITCFAENTFLQVMMADVSGGSESPSMAKQVLQWRTKCIQEQNGIQASDMKVPHWDDVSIINRQIIHTLQQIHTLVPTADHDLQQLYIDIPSNEWMTRMDHHISLTELLLSLKELYVQQRYHMKQMGIMAGNVPIEPDIQTTLCNDVTTNVAGVIATMVPGAGGYDAISILYIHHPTVHLNITNYLSNYIPQNVCALTVQGVAYNDGLRIETQFPI